MIIVKTNVSADQVQQPKKSFGIDLRKTLQWLRKKRRSLRKKSSNKSLT